MAPVDFAGWMLLFIGLGVAIGVLAGYSRGFQVFRKQLAEHHASLEAFYAPLREENERLRDEILTVGASNEELARENDRYEQTLTEWEREITGLHHALDAQAEANLMYEEELHATAPRKVTRIRARKQPTKESSG